jgi:hypothetical protein
MNVATELFDAGVRIERVIWLDGVVCTDGPTEDFEDFFDLDDDHLNALLPELGGDFNGEARHALEYLYAARGFLIQAASPVRNYSWGGGTFSSSWGHYRTQWFRVLRPEDAVTRIIEWAEAMGAADRAETEVAKPAPVSP